MIHPLEDMNACTKCLPGEDSDLLVALQEKSMHHQEQWDSSSEDNECQTAKFVMNHVSPSNGCQRRHPDSHAAKNTTNLL